MLPIEATDPIGCLTDGCYEARFFLTRGTAEIYLGHVDVYELGAHKCRIAIAGLLGHEAAVDALESKARFWISARNRGVAAGATHFDELVTEPVAELGSPLH